MQLEMRSGVQSDLSDGRETNAICLVSLFTVVRLWFANRFWPRIECREEGLRSPALSRKNDDHCPTDPEKEKEWREGGRENER